MPNKHIYHGSNYMKYGFLVGKERQNTIKQARKSLKKVRFEGIAFSGNSGCLTASLLAIPMKKAMVLVRKSLRNCHSCYEVEGHTDIKSYIIVDDCISSGATKRRIIKKMKKYCPKAKYLGTYEVDDDIFHPEEEGE